MDKEDKFQDCRGSFSQDHFPKQFIKESVDIENRSQDLRHVRNCTLTVSATTIRWT